MAYTVWEKWSKDYLKHANLSERTYLASYSTWPFSLFTKPPPPVVLEFIGYKLGLLSSLSLAVGLFSRSSAALFAISFAQFFIYEASTFNNHYYAFFLVGIVLSLVESSTLLSVDAWLWPATHRATHLPRINLLLLQFIICIVYFYGGVAKVNQDWLRGQPLTMWLSEVGNLSNASIVQHFLSMHNVFWGILMSYIGVYVDLMFPIEVWLGYGIRFPRLSVRQSALLRMTIFHSLNSQIFSIGTFPYAMLASNFLFLAPDITNTIVYRLESTLSLVREKKEEKAVAPCFSQTRWLLTIVLVIHQLVTPLRWLAIDYNINWTSQCHLFSWRMMLNNYDTLARLRLTVIDEYLHRSHHLQSPFDVVKLSKRQMKRGVKNIDQMQHFINHLSMRYDAEFIGTKAVDGSGALISSLSLDFWRRYNDRPYQRYFDDEDARESSLYKHIRPLLSLPVDIRNEIRSADLYDHRRDFYYFAEPVGGVSLHFFGGGCGRRGVFSMLVGQLVVYDEDDIDDNDNDKMIIVSGRNASIAVGDNEDGRYYRFVAMAGSDQTDVVVWRVDIIEGSAKEYFKCQRFELLD